MQGVNEKIVKYGDCTITRFDIVGSFFVYLFYNELFKKSKELKNQTTSKSTTDTYKELLVAYSEFTNSNEFFKQAVKGIHNYVVTNTNQIDMTHKECIDFIVGEFVPNGIFTSMRDVHKNKLLHEALSSVVKQFISKVISKYLRVIIDVRDSSNIVILQNEFLDIICIEKDKVYSKFISNNKKSDTISVDIYKKKLAEIKQEYEKRISMLISALESQKKNNDVLEAVNQKSSEIIKQLQSMVRANEIKKKNTEADEAKPKLEAKPKIEVKPKIEDKIEIISPKSVVQKSSEDTEDQDGSNLLFDDADPYY